MIAPNEVEKNLTLEELCSKFTEKEDFNYEKINSDLKDIKILNYKLKKLEKQKNNALGTQRRDNIAIKKVEKAAAGLKPLNLTVPVLDFELKKAKQSYAHSKRKVAEIVKKIQEVEKIVDLKMENFEEEHEDWMSANRYYSLEELIRRNIELDSLVNPLQILNNSDQVRRFVEYLESRGWNKLDLVNTSNGVYCDGNSVSIEELYK